MYVGFGSGSGRIGLSVFGQQRTLASAREADVQPSVPSFCLMHLERRIRVREASRLRPTWSPASGSGKSRTWTRRSPAGGQKAPLKLKDIWSIRVRLQIGRRTRELALFNLAIDSKLRSCDLVRLRMRDVCHGNGVAARTMVMQQKTQRPVQFEITEQTRESLTAWIRSSGSIHLLIYPLGSMHVSYVCGFGTSVLMPARMAPNRPRPDGDPSKLVAI
ncbi:MAG: integrase family protein [Gammaproteobacteria bacterium]|nr:integrase family protein [Gammaproteobacteria bacterium]